MKSNVPVSRHGPGWQSRLSTLAIVVFLTLLIGSLFIVLNLAHQIKTVTQSLLIILLPAQTSLTT